MASFEITRKGWIWIFVTIVVLILIVVFAVKANATDKGGIKDTRSKTSTDCCGELSDCYGLSKIQTESLQKELNSKGCKDYNGQILSVDSVCGPKTNSAIKNCLNK